MSLSSSSSDGKQAADQEEEGRGAGGKSHASGAARTAGASAALMRRLACQLLQRRSLGAAPCSSPLLMQTGGQHLVAATRGRLLACMPLPADAAAPKAAPGAPLAPVVPHLTAVSPACLVLPPKPTAAEAMRGSHIEPAALLLTGHGLFNQDGRPALVLCRQHGAENAPICPWPRCHRSLVLLTLLLLPSSSCSPALLSPVHSIRLLLQAATCQ